MKKTLLVKLHLYSGIFTSFYLMAFGFSALVLNHDLKVENTQITRTWESYITIDQSLPDVQLAESIRDKMGFMGWQPTWEFKRDSASFAFNIVHPGRKYHIDANLESGHLKISESPKGFLAVFHGLHFLNGKIPNAPFLLRTWVVYQWLALFVMFISLVLGIWLWLKYNYKPWQGIAFGGLFLATVLIMIFL